MSADKKNQSEEELKSIKSKPTVDDKLKGKIDEKLKYFNNPLKKQK